MAEADLRAAARTLETLAVIEPEFGRVAAWAYRLAQRVAIDSGRLDAAA